MIAEDDKALVELGDDWGVSKERIRQLKDRALHRLRTGTLTRRLEAHLN